MIIWLTDKAITPIKKKVNVMKQVLTVDAYKKSKSALRRLRSNIFSYNQDKEAQAGRVIDALVARTMRNNRNGRLAQSSAKGYWSGLTKSELARSGPCETDWF